MKISQIGSRGIPGHQGGVERVIDAVAPRLVRLGHEVTVYCANWGEYREPQYKGVLLRYVYSVRSKHLDTVVRSVLATFLAMFTRCDVVHFHGIGSAPLALLVRIFGKKTVVTVHGLDWQRRKWNAFVQRVLQLTEWAAVRIPHRTIVVGLELKRALDRRYGTDVIYIPNGVEQRPTRKVDRLHEFDVSARNYILYLARLVPEKQCHVLIEAFKQMRRAAGMKLIIAGPTWHSKAYVASLKKLAAGDPSIVLAGEVDEVLLEKLYSNCYAYVLPSEVEGMSLSLLDAMAFGACVVASDIPANADMVNDCGVLFATRDAADLARKLGDLVSDPTRAERYRVAARGRVTDEFHWDKIARQWEDVYRSLA
jgi:glycosyltransferase involved in cell wall biosynthesis